MEQDWKDFHTQDNKKKWCHRQTQLKYDVHMTFGNLTDLTITVDYP